MKYPETIENLITCYKRLPGVGHKTAERMALATLKMDDEMVALFADSLINSKEKLKKCHLCNNITEKTECFVCSDHSREKKTLCIVEDAKKIIMLEKLNVFKGLYHIIEEPVSPMIGNERIEKENIEELIFALKLTIEGETTMAYITRLVGDRDIKITKIAQGVPHGADIDYIDNFTLEKAFEERKQL